MKKCILCKKEIPKTRKRSAVYCSDECYYAAKKERSSKKYAILKAPVDEIKRNENILSYLFGVAKLNKSINANDLVAYSFNFGISTGEHKHEVYGPCKIIGKYVYYYHSDKKLEIWKLK